MKIRIDLMDLHATFIDPVITKGKSTDWFPNKEGELKEYPQEIRVRYKTEEGKNKEARFTGVYAREVLDKVERYQAGE